MGLKRVRCVAQVLAAEQPHHRREQNEHALGPDFHLVVDACSLALGAEAEEVAAPQRLDVRHESDSRVRLELLEFLDDFADAAQLPLEPGAVADWSGVEPAGGPDCGVPVGPASAVYDDGKDLVNCLLDELSTGDECHLASESRVGTAAAGVQRLMRPSVIWTSAISRQRGAHSEIQIPRATGSGCV